MSRRVVLALLFILTVAGGCGDRTEHAQTSRPAATNSAGRRMPADAAPLDRQVFRGIVAEPKTLDLTIDAYSAGDLIHLFETLVVVTSDLGLQPGAAERWESNPDGTRWTFHLRHGNHWSDGHPVTAHDFEYSLKRLLDPKEGSNYAFVYYDIKGARAFNGRKMTNRAAVGIRAVDDYTLVIETEKPTPYLPQILAFVTATPVPRWQVEKYGQKWTEGTNSVASGPYMIAEWVHGGQLTFVPNPRYSGPNTGYLEKIRWIFSEDPSAHLPAYENDEVDTHPLSPIEVGRVEQHPRLSRELIRTHTFTTWYLFFKTQASPFNDVHVRRAIAHAIDRSAICRVVLKGAGIPAYTMLPPGMPDHLGTRYREYQEYDPARARALMAEAGYPGGRGFPRVEMWLRQANSVDLQVAQVIQEMLKEILGITVTLKNQELQVYFDNMYRYEIPMSLIPFNQDFADPSNMITMVWRSRQVGFGRHDWTNPAFDRLVDAAGMEMNPQKRSELYQEAQRILTQDAGGVFVYYQVGFSLVKPWVKNYVAGDAPGYPGFKKMNRVWDIYIDNDVLAKR